MRNVIRQSTVLLSWRIVLSALCGVCLLVMSTVSQAQSALDWSVTISSGMPPPPVLRYEPMPVARPGHLWVQGFWDWNGVAYVWVPGRWIIARAGYSYVQPAWREGPHGWDLRRGGWHRSGPDFDDRSSERGAGHCPPGHRRKGEC